MAARCEGFLSDQSEEEADFVLAGVLLVEDDVSDFGLSDLGLSVFAPSDLLPSDLPPSVEVLVELLPPRLSVL